MEEYKPIKKYRIVTTKTTYIPGSSPKEEVTQGEIPRSHVREDFLIPQGAAVLSRNNVDGVLILNFRRDLLFGFEHYYREVIPIIEPKEKPKTNPGFLKFTLSFYGIELGEI